MSGKLTFLVLLLQLFSDCVQAADPHESISKRTPSGIPYYFQSHRFEHTIYSKTGLLILEFSTVNSSFQYKSQPSLFWSYLRGELDDNVILSSALSSCQLGDLFHGIYLSKTERERLFDRISSSCYSNKFQVHKVENVYFSNSDAYYEEVKWTHALTECRSKKIPNSLIPPKNLKDYLERFSESVLESGVMELSIPVEDLMLYYEVSITSCAFTENSLIVAIQVPARARENGYNSITPTRSYHLIPIPLVVPTESDIVCFMQDRSDFHFLEGTYLYSNLAKDAIRQERLSCSDESPHQLCFLPTSTITKRSMRRSCLQSIIEGKDEDITCILKCEPSATFNFPIIRSVASDRYLIVGLKFNDEVRVECPPFQKEETLLFPPSGALEIILPCDCHIRYEESTFKSTTPCGAEFSKIPINFPGTFDIRDIIN